MDRFGRLARRVADIDAQGLRRRLREVTPLSATEVVVDGRRATLWCANDYLGLANHPELVAATAGGGAGAARLVSGNRPAHRALEDALSERFGRPATLFSSGYHANLALYATLGEEGDLVASDALNHASFIDGLRLSRARRMVLPPLDPAVPAEARMVVVESLYSMDGDSPDLAAYRGPWWLAVDEAHAFGTIGPGGRGVAAAQGVTPDVIVGTLGKAAGGYGAFVVGPPEVRELLLSQGRSFIFTTGLPEPAAHAALAALEVMADGALQGRLHENVARLRRGLADLGLHAPGEDHIVPIVLGPRTMAVAAALLAAGYYAAGIRPPTVAPGAERIRLTLSAAHTAEQIDGLLESLARACSAP